MADPSVYSLTGVDFGYGDTPVLKSLDLELVKGCFHGVLGPNGAGKSTLLDLLAGIRQPLRGGIAFQGRPLRAYGRTRLSRSISLVPQEYAIQFPFTVREVVLMGRHPHLSRFGPPAEEDLALVDKALAAMDLESMAGKSITALSGGEKQRVVLARSLAQDNEIMIMDEPTANLDINHALTALSLVRNLVRGEGRTVIAVMHDLNLAAQFCDRVTILKEGRVHSSGHVEETLTERNIREVFQVEARVRPDEFTGANFVSYRAWKKKDHDT